MALALFLPLQTAESESKLALLAKFVHTKQNVTAACLWSRYFIQSKTKQNKRLSSNYNMQLKIVKKI